MSPSDPPTPATPPPTRVDPDDVVLEPPSARALLERVVDFLDHEVYPAQTNAKLRLRVRVASNVIRLVGRELDGTADLVVDEDGYAVPAAVVDRYGSLTKLAQSLRAGDLDLVDPAAYAVVREHVEAKVRIAAPHHLVDDDEDIDPEEGERP
jgi:hypothetical protein